MAQNIELKAAYPDLEKAREKTDALDCVFDGREQQTDTFYKVPNGRLKLRESSRFGTRLIPYIRTDSVTAKSSQYALLPVDDPATLKELFDKMFGIMLIVRKFRDVYFYENVRIHLDEVEQLGSFIEFEAIVQSAGEIETDKEKVDYLKQYFEIKNSDLIACAYADLLIK